MRDWNMLWAAWAVHWSWRAPRRNLLMPMRATAPSCRYGIGSRPLLLWNICDKKIINTIFYEYDSVICSTKNLFPYFGTGFCRTLQMISATFGSCKQLETLTFSPYQWFEDDREHGLPIFVLLPFCKQASVKETVSTLWHQVFPAVQLWNDLWLLIITWKVNLPFVMTSELGWTEISARPILKNEEVDETYYRHCKWKI